MINDYYLNDTKYNLTAVGMITKGLLSDTPVVAKSRISNSTPKQQILGMCAILDVIDVPAHELSSIAKLTFFQSRKADGGYVLNVLIAPNISYIHAKFSKMLSLCNDVKENLLNIKAFIESLYLKYKQSTQR